MEYVVPERITFSGDHQKESEFLNNFQEQTNFPPLEIHNVHLFTARTTSKATIYLDALTRLKQLLNASKNNFTAESANYLDHELQAYIYMNLFDARPEDLIKDRPFLFPGPIIPVKLQFQIQSQLDTFNIHRIYNDYGIFSRQLTQSLSNINMIA